MMIVLWTYIIVGSVSLSQIQAEYCISNQNGSASNATALCTLATPKFTVEGKHYIINFTTSFNGPLWIGYAETAFTYIGCAMNVQNMIEGHSILDVNPSTCYYHCNTSYIGLGYDASDKKIKCFCIQYTPDDVFERTCRSTQHCISQMGIVCGGVNVVSVYQPVSYPDTSFPDPAPIPHTDPGHCLAYEPSKQYLFWTSCSLSLRYLCLNGSDILVNSTASSKTWDDAMQECLKNRMRPASASGNFSNVPTGGSQYWTGTIRSFGICNSEGSSRKCKGGNIRQGYTDKFYTKYEIRFGLNQSTAALCNEANDSSACKPEPDTTSSIEGSSTIGTTSSIEGSSTIGTTSSIEGSSTIGTTSSIEGSSTIGTTSSIEGSSTIGTTSSIEGSSTIGTTAGLVGSSGGMDTSLIGVYVAVPLILVLIVAVIGGVVLWRKRKRSFGSKSKGNGTAFNSSGHTNGTGQSLSNAAYQADCPVVTKAEQMRNDYIELDPTNEYAAISDTDIEKADEDKYDTTEKVNAKGDSVANESRNIYNRLSSVKEDLYNHTNTKIDINDETYNHLEASPTKHAPGKTNGLVIKQNNRPDYTYSHLDGVGKGKSSSLTKQNSSSTTENKDDIYDQTSGYNPVPQKQSVKSKSNAQPLTRKSDSTTKNSKPNYDYACATKAGQSGLSKTSKFTFGPISTSSDYEFAKDPTPAPGYEFAKPTPEYLELSDI